MSELNAIFAVAIKAIENEFNRRKAEDKAQIAKLEAEKAKDKAQIVKLEAQIVKNEAEKAEDKAQFAKLEAQIAKIEARLNEPVSASQQQVDPISVVNAKAKSKKEKINASSKKSRDKQRRNCVCGGITSSKRNGRIAIDHEGTDKHQNWLKANNLCLPAVDLEEEDDAFSCLSEGDEE
jgi:chromosome segregation ATPase